MNQTNLALEFLKPGGNPRPVAPAPHVRARPQLMLSAAHPDSPAARRRRARRRLRARRRADHGFRRFRVT